MSIDLTIKREHQETEAPTIKNIVDNVQAPQTTKAQSKAEQKELHTTEQPSNRPFEDKSVVGEGSNPKEQPYDGGTPRQSSEAQIKDDLFGNNRGTRGDNVRLSRSFEHGRNTELNSSGFLDRALSNSMQVENERCRKKRGSTTSNTNGFLPYLSPSKGLKVNESVLLSAKKQSSPTEVNKAQSNPRRGRYKQSNRSTKQHSEQESRKQEPKKKESSSESTKRQQKLLSSPYRSSKQSILQEHSNQLSQEQQQPAAAAALATLRQRY